MQRHPLPSYVRWTALSAVAVGTLSLAELGRAESLWAKRNQRAANLFVDTRARRTGDLLIVRIREVTGIDEQDQRKLDKKTDTDGAFSFEGKSSSNSVARAAAASFTSNQESNRTLEGSSEYASDRTFRDQITCTVIDVLPNGNLVVEGVRSRMVAGDKRVMRVSGIVRPDDIQLGNFVDSPVMANFKIVYEGEGDSVRYTSHGWLGRAVTKIWPF
jgi:flagellar L-ring protein precursor FlgH